MTTTTLSHYASLRTDSPMLKYLGAAVISLGIGAAVAQQDAAWALIAAAISIAAIVGAVPALLPAAVLVIPLLVAQVSALGGVFALLVLLIIFGVTHRSILHPFVLLGVPISLYVIVGGANITSYRGSVTPETLRLILLHVLTLLIGVALTGGFKRRALARPVRMVASPDLIVLSFIPGIVGIGLIIQAVGIPLLHPGSRTSLSGPTLLLTETLLAALTLYCCVTFSQRKPIGRDIAVIAGALLALAMSGYRGWPVIGLMLVICCGVYFGRLRVTAFRALIAAGAVILIIAGGDVIRRNTDNGANADLLTTRDREVKYNAQDLPPVTAQIHFAFRESIALTQSLVQDRENGKRMPQSLLLADFYTMLPGEQPSGGDLVGTLVGVQGDAGLTAGAVGVAFLDIGLLGFILFLIVGSLIGRIWRLAAEAPRWGMIYFLVLIYTVHFFHRGIPKPSYLVVPLFFFSLSLLVQSLGRVETNEPRLA